MFDLTGKTALVTGASGGIGSAIVTALAARGANLVLTGTRENILKEVAASLDLKSDQKAEIITANLSETEAATQLIADTEAAVGPVDILVNNAGLTRDGLLMRMKEEDWQTEYLAPILSIRTVANIDEAMNHIERYGSKHTDAIITTNKVNADRFLREVDSASVMVNASTRFADGFEYGLGAEIGISNDKLHARGPVGLDGLTSLKYVVLGHGEIRT